MQDRGFWRLDQVSDEQLLGGLRELLTEEGRCEARIVAHLAEVDERRIALKAAQSLFEYCQEQLGFSDSQAYYRIAAARVATRFPVVFQMLERREIHLVNIAPLSKLLTEENHRELLSQAALLSKRAFLKFLAQRYPRPDVASGIRRLPPPAGSASAGPTGSIEPRSATTYRLQLNTSESLKEKLELARDLMSHANPGGDLAVVVERALDVLIEKLKSRRFGETKRPRKSALALASATDLHRSKSANDQSGQHEPRSTARPHTSHETRRNVLARDGLRCTYVSAEGRRCSSRAFLQFDHEHGFAEGGGNSSRNLRFLCHAHNQLRAELTYGKAHIQSARQSAHALSKV